MELSNEAIKEVLDKVVDQYLIPKFYELNMNASGQWVRSLETDAEKAVGVIKGQDYTKYLVQGREPNQDQDPKKLRAWAYYYGTTVIADWAKAKGIDIDPIAIAYKIAREGTTWKAKGGSDLLEVLESPEVKAFIARELSGYMSDQIRLEIIRIANKIIT